MIRATAVFMTVVAVALLCPAVADALPAARAYEFEITRDWLIMPDGVRLSVTYFLPKARSVGERFPVLLELLPYRKDDSFYIRDYPLYSYFARRGFAMAKVDVRGTGSSEGAVPDREYSDAELNDADEIIRQLGHMRWSNGNVGMWGISWGGFNALQVAMRQPPELKAILAAHASDDLYHDDVRYIDGIYHKDEYELTIDHENALPQSPDYPLDEKYSEQRFNAQPWLLTYLKQQKDGPFWRSHSLRWRERKVQVPVYLIGGLLDGYRDTPLRLLENLRAPVKAVMGPYQHDWPDNGEPGPTYEWRHEAVRWFNHWLRGEDTGIMKEPRLALFVRDYVPPDVTLKTTPGHWRYEDWPITRTRWTRFHLGREHDLRAAAGRPDVHRLAYSPGYGFETGYWWGDPTGDQRPADAKSLVYDSAPLTAPMEIAGLPRVRLKARANVKLLHWMVRLEDVAPDGRVSLVGGGALNGAQRKSRLQPEYLTPGKTMLLDIPLHFTTWTFRPGHRIRLAVSNALFPMLWPTPYAAASELEVGNKETWLELPAVPLETRAVPRFLASKPREHRPEAKRLEFDDSKRINRVTRDAQGRTTVEWDQEYGYELAGGRYHIYQKSTYRTTDADPANSSFEGINWTEMDFTSGRKLRVESWVEIRSDVTHFHFTFTRRVFENGTPIRERTWKESVVREFQ